MAIKRHPKRNNFLGVHWTQWPWPSMVAKAIYRRYGPRVGNPEKNQMIANRLSLAYLFCAFTLVGVVAIAAMNSEMDDGPGSRFGWAKYWLKKRELEEHKVMYYKMEGVSVVKKEEVTEEIKGKLTK